MTKHVAMNEWEFDHSTHPRWADQVELEMEMRDQGVSRFRRLVRKAREKGDQSQLPHVRRLIDQFIEPISLTLKEFLEKQRRSRGVKHISLKYLVQLEPEVVAYITLRQLMTELTTGDAPLARAALGVSKAIQEEIRLEAWRKAHPDVWDTYQWKLSQDKATTEHKLKVLRYGYNKLRKEGKIEVEEMTHGERVHVGTHLINLLCKATGRFEIVLAREGKTRTVNYVRPTSDTAEWLSKALRKQELLLPEWLPCVMPPRAWTTPTSGAYYTGVVEQYPLVEFGNLGRGKKKEAMAVLKSADLEFVFLSVNMLQETGWCVNREVLEVAEHLRKIGNEIGSLPRLSKLDLPEKPEDIDTNEEARRIWKSQAKEVYQRNAELVGKNLGAEKTLALARRFQHEEVFYFPHYLDFRGRVYPKVPNFNPQGNDLAKGLLLFAEGKAIETQEAEEWLAIHVANCFGVDKVSYDERVAWVRENEKQIIAWAQEPLNDLGWADADGGDSAFQFLAACKEWAAYRKYGKGYLSRLPVRVDGTCNGLQHLSALLRDYSGGEATNLVPSDTPSDIYKDVGKVVQRKLEILGDPSVMERKADLAQKLLKMMGGVVPRDLTKRPVMIIPYGGTNIGVRGYVEEWMMKADPHRLHVSREDWQEALSVLTEVIWKSIFEVVVSAEQAFRWIKGVAKLAAGSGKPLVWWTPAGLPVFHFYPDQKAKEVEVNSLQTRIKVWINRSSDTELAMSEQLSGVAPNFVHSLDAAALMLTLVNLQNVGVRSVTTIHDSYGTHAAQMGTLGQVLRASFVGMYRQCDPLEDFREVCLELAPEEDHYKMPPVPPKGELELEEVLSSPYFFA